MKLTLKTVTALAKLAAQTDDEQIQAILEDASRQVLDRSIVLAREALQGNTPRQRAIMYVNRNFTWEKKIPAIKYVRNELGIGLKDAKDLVEQETHFRSRPSRR